MSGRTEFPSPRRGGGLGWGASYHTHANLLDAFGDAKRSFETVRSQAELGNEGSLRI